MTGTAAHERALEGPVNGRYHGLFSYALYQGFGRVPLDASVKEVFWETQKELNKLQSQMGRPSMATPQLEAPSKRLDSPLFPLPQEGALPGKRLAQAPRLSWIPVQQLSPDRVLLKEGNVLGEYRAPYGEFIRPGKWTFLPVPLKPMSRWWNVKMMTLWLKSCRKEAQLPAIRVQS